MTETLLHTSSSVRPSAGVTGDSLPLPLTSGHSAARPQPAVRHPRRDRWPSLETRLVGPCLGHLCARLDIRALGAASEASEPLPNGDMHQGKKAKAAKVRWSGGASSDVSVTPLLTRAALPTSWPKIRREQSQNFKSGASMLPRRRPSVRGRAFSSNSETKFCCVFTSVA